MYMDVRKTVVNSFVVSRVDYCNSLLAGVPRYQLDRLQSVMNTAARLIVGAKRQDRIKHVLRDRLHWLPVPQRVQFKVCLLTYKALHGLAPSYIADLCRPSQPSVADRDSDLPLVATSLSPPLSRTLAPVHLLWRVQGLESTANAHTSTGVSWLLQDGTKVTSPLR